jgi:hypothetical protein
MKSVLPLKKLTNQGYSHFIVPLVAVLLIVVVGAKIYTSTGHAQTITTSTPATTVSSCAVSAMLVNSCHPLFGAAVGGDSKATATDPVSQFSYLESLIGRKMDLFHDYHSPGSQPLNAAEETMAARANTYDYVNWKPASNWADADGGDAAVNATIKQAADSIKAIAPHKIFVTVWHEPENDVSAFDNSTESNACKNSSSFVGLKGSAGTPAQYVAMWQNVHKIFNAEGVTNVVWAMNYMGYKNWDCLVPYMWPGNNLVDWVTFDAYGSGSNPTWAGSVGRFYNVLQADNSTVNNFDAKPWGSAEYNICGNTDANITSYFASAKAALDANSYPRLQMYMVFDSADGPGGTAGCLVDRDSATLAAFKSFANDPLFTSTTSSAQKLAVTVQSPVSSATLSGTVTIKGVIGGSGDPTYVSLRIDNKFQEGLAGPSSSFSLSFNTTKLANGTHTLILRGWNAAHHYFDSTPVQVTVKN